MHRRCGDLALHRWARISLAAALCALPAVAAAERPAALVPAAAPAPAAAGPARSTADLDGLYVWLGPSGAAVQIESAWHSTWGAGLQVVRVRERAGLGVVGGWLSGVHYAGRDGGRVALEAVVGTRRLGGPMLGVGAGPVVELGERHHPRPGGQVSAWMFAGIAPFVRVGVVAEAGAYLELGVQVSLPARRW